jgi:hypothetical protein
MAFNGNKSLSDINKSNSAGYFALTDLVTTDKRKGDTIMSLWLAPKPLLMALFQNEDIVQEVIEYRKELHYESKKENRPAGDKENDFKLRFSPHIQIIDAKYVDFKVSGTPPPDLSRTPRRKKNK